VPFGCRCAEPGRAQTRPRELMELTFRGATYQVSQL
jgi:hypothetical protein